jgi:hypothetical protein
MWVQIAGGVPEKTTLAEEFFGVLAELEVGQEDSGAPSPGGSSLVADESAEVLTKAFSEGTLHCVVGFFVE